jgi:protein phosphatase
VNSQYFIGEGPGGEVSVYQGIEGSMLGLSLNSQVEGSCAPDAARCDKLLVADLNSFGQDVVRTGRLTAESLPDARKQITELRLNYQLGPCAPTTSTPSTTPPTSTTPPVDAPGLPPGGQTGGGQTATTSPTAPTSPTSPTSSTAPTQGVQCPTGEGGG